MFFNVINHANSMNNYKMAQMHFVITPISKSLTL